MEKPVAGDRSALRRSLAGGASSTSCCRSPRMFRDTRSRSAARTVARMPHRCGGNQSTGDGQLALHHIPRLPLTRQVDPAHRVCPAQTRYRYGPSAAWRLAGGGRRPHTMAACVLNPQRSRWQTAQVDMRTGSHMDAGRRPAETHESLRMSVRRQLRQSETNWTRPRLASAQNVSLRCGNR
jgi:hypothetical protein